MATFSDECDDIRELDQTGLKHVFRDTGQVHVFGCHTRTRLSHVFKAFMIVTACFYPKIQRLAKYFSVESTSLKFTSSNYNLFLSHVRSKIKL